MPEITGDECCRILHEKYSKDDLPPIVALSATVTEPETLRWLALGMSAVLPKPLRVAALAKLIEGLPLQANKGRASEQSSGGGQSGTKENENEN